MKLIAIIFLLFLTATPVLAAKSNNGQKETNSKKNIELINNTSSTSATKCNPDDEWKNHGEYVSCVAKLKLGGNVVSEAAKSDIGKKSNEKDEDENKNENENSTATPSPHLNLTPTPTPSAISSPILTVRTKAAQLHVKSVLEILNQILESLHKLIS